LKPCETPALPSRTLRLQLSDAPAPAQPGHLLVWVGNNAHAEALVRQAALLAGALQLSWTAICIDTPATAGGSMAQRAQALEALSLAEGLGASVDNVHAVNVFEAIVERVQAERATLVLIGDHPADGWLELQRRHWLGGLADALSARLPGVTVQSIHFPALDTPRAPVGVRGLRPSTPRQGWLRALLVVGLCTAVSELLLPYTERATLITVYLVGVV
jgi:two-component system sensor histidine kinase KdpD